MAAPLVAGTVALLLEEARAEGQVLNHDEVKGLLVEYANRVGIGVDPGAAGYAEIDRNRYGFGRLRAIGPIDHLQPPLTVDVWVRTAEDDFGLQPFTGNCSCRAPGIRVIDPATGDETTEISWGTEYEVIVTVRNLGDDNAIGTTVNLKYTLPWTAPSTWYPAEDDADVVQQQVVDVPALDQLEVTFHWRPEMAEIGGAAGTTHFCLLAEVDHVLDPLTFDADTDDAWANNIRGTNNVALRNVHIQ